MKRKKRKEEPLTLFPSDRVSNESHELRTPLALIQLYAETLELGRITTEEKRQEYYRLIRKECERLSARMICQIMPDLVFTQTLALGIPVS